MFATIGNTINIPTSTTLVATALPSSLALRVPYDNVPPPVSSLKLDNNASSNLTQIAKTENQEQPVSVANNTAEKFILPAASNTTSITANAQTAFLTQLASGDISPEVYGIFVQYDKLVSYANVKYKPSNAGKPVDPIGLFSTLLQLEKESHPLDVAAIEPAVDTEHFQPEYNAPEPDYISPPEDFFTKPEIAIESHELYKSIEPVLSQLGAYNAAISRNLDTAPNELESA